MISVAMCTYNGELYIEEQIRSILNQTYPVDQIVVCDDGSTDGTVCIIQKLFEKISSVEKILIVNETRKGVTKNFEQALKLCNGNFIFLSDQDDIWVEDKVEKTIQIMEQNKSCLLFFSDAYLVDEKKNLLEKSLWDNIKFKKKKTYKIEDFLGTRFVTGATVALKKELLDCLPIPECWIHDAWLAINASILGGVIASDKKTILYRQHSNNVIGVRKPSHIKHIMYCVKNIEKSIGFKKIMKKRFQSFIERNSENISENMLDELKKCEGFWEETSILLDVSFGKGLCLINKNFVSGNYQKYSNGIYSLLIDLYINIIYRYKRR